MAKKELTPAKRGGTKSPKQNGTPFAPNCSAVKEPEKTLTSTQVHPIDTLLVHQLEHLLNGEAALRARYSKIDPSENSVEVRMAFSKELGELKDRADRLYRLVNAMDNYAPAEPKRQALRPAIA